MKISFYCEDKPDRLDWKYVEDHWERDINSLYSLMQTLKNMKRRNPSFNFELFINENQDSLDILVGREE